MKCSDSCEDLSHRWTRFGAGPYKEALKQGLRLGDGICRRILIDNGNGLIVEGFQPMILIEVLAHQFIAKDIYNRLHACRWDEALGYKKQS